MSYVVVVFSPSAPFAPRFLHGHGSPAGALVQGSAVPYPFNVWQDVMLARREAISMSRNFGRFVTGGYETARYAVFPLADVMWSDDAVEVDAVGAPSVMLLSSRPVFVPHGCEDLAVHYGWEAFTQGAADYSGLTPYSAAAPVLAAPAPVPWAMVDEFAVFSLSSAASVLRPLPPAPVAVPSAASGPVVRFEVRAGLNGTDRDEWSCVHEADNGKDAAAWVAGRKAGYAESGKSLAIVRVVIDPDAPKADWRERERERLASGEYTALPGNWADMIASAYPDHFAHVASSDKRKVAFTETDAAGERDKQKVLSASAYVERFFSNYDDYYSRDPLRTVRFWHEYTRNDFLGDMLGDSVNVLFAPLGDVDAMMLVYRDCLGGPSHGCMSMAMGDYASRRVDLHPTAAYAQGGEITVALLRGFPDGIDPETGERDADGINPDAEFDSGGVVLSRCLVWPKGKEYGRVYGTSHHARMLRTALEAQGYSDGDLAGAKVAKIPVPGYGSNAFVMPYLDIGGGMIEDCGDYFEVGGNIQATRTDGVVYAVQMVECEHCQDDHDEDESDSVYIGEDETETWCRSCRSNDAFYCGHTGAYVSDSHAAWYYPEGSSYDERIADWCLSEVGATLCEDGSYRVDAFQCADCSECFPDSEQTAWDGRPTGDESHADGDSLCSSCHDEREQLADDYAQAELPLEETDGSCAAVAA